MLMICCSGMEVNGAILTATCRLNFPSFESSKSRPRVCCLQGMFLNSQSRLGDIKSTGSYQTILLLNISNLGMSLHVMCPVMSGLNDCVVD